MVVFCTKQINFKAFLSSLKLFFVGFLRLCISLWSRFCSQLQKIISSENLKRKFIFVKNKVAICMLCVIAYVEVIMWKNLISPIQAAENLELA